MDEHDKQGIKMFAMLCVGGLTMFLVLSIFNAFTSTSAVEPSLCPGANETAILSSQLAACINMTNQLVDPVIMTDGYGHFACCSKVGQCKAVPNFILNATNNTGGS